MVIPAGDEPLTIRAESHAPYLASLFPEFHGLIGHTVYFKDKNRFKRVNGSEQFLAIGTKSNLINRIHQSANHLGFGGGVVQVPHAYGFVFCRSGEPLSVAA